MASQASSTSSGSLTATGFSLLTLPFGWVIPDWGTAAMLVTAGLIGGVGQILLTSAYRHAEAVVLAPFDYASLLFAILIGWVFFSEWPTLMVLLGSAVIMAAGILIIWREYALGIERGKARQTMTPNG